MYLPSFLASTTDHDAIIARLAAVFSAPSPWVSVSPPLDELTRRLGKLNCEDIRSSICGLACCHHTLQSLCPLKVMQWPRSPCPSFVYPPLAPMRCVTYIWRTSSLLSRFIALCSDSAVFSTILAREFRSPVVNGMLNWSGESGIGACAPTILWFGRNFFLDRSG